MLNFYKNTPEEFHWSSTGGGGRKLKYYATAHFDTQRKIAIPASVPASHKCTSYMVRYRPKNLKNNLKNNLNWVGAGVRDVGLKRVSKYLFRDDEFRGQDL